MGLLLKNRDYAADGSGGVAVVRDGEALLNEVLFRLAARRGRSWQRNLLPTMTHSGLMLPGLGAVPAGDLWRWKRPYPWQTVCRIPCMG